MNYHRPFRSPRTVAWGTACASLSLLASPLWAAPVPSPLESVNPMIGTDVHGHTYPGATLPFGMVQLSPDTPMRGWDGCSGYHYSDKAILGFSHTHLSGTGIGGLGDIEIMPTIGEVRLDAGTPGNGYSSAFTHEKEKATPGYYRVFLDTPGITAELTATTRCGYHRYTFPASQNAHIVLDLVRGINNKPIESTLKVENSTTISGSRLCDDWGGKREIYFVMQFSKPFNSFGIEGDGTRTGPETKEARAKNLKAFVDYGTKAGETIELKVGISATSIEGARKNLNTELPAWNFDKVRAAAAQKWSESLNKAQIQTADPKIRTTFYTNLYESLLSPTVFNDADGTYRGLDRQNHPSTGFNNYTTFSLWDTFRAQAPLLTLLEPKAVPDMVSSMLAHYKQFGEGNMPVWPLWGNETWCMIGNNSIPVIVDAYMKGLRGYDAEAVYQGIKVTQMQEREQMDEYRQYGYVLSAGGHNSVAKTLEYAFNDWCVAQMAQSLGHTEDAKLFYARAANYRNVFDKSTGFMRGRKADGSWRAPFNPKELTRDDYTEANAWHYSWAVMQDIPGLVNILGGDRKFENKLDSLFTESSEFISGIPDITGVIGQYAHGNEPVHHVAYLYNYAGIPSKTQQRVREIMTKFYDDTPAGQVGNNDCGQMSAWYVFSALGFYPVNPAQGTYVIGSPLIDKATLRLDNKRTFTITAQNNSPQNIYIQSATLNGKPLNNSWFTHADLLKGGQLTLTMGPKPNYAWGQSTTNRPPSGMPQNFQYPALPTGS